MYIVKQDRQIKKNADILLVCGDGKTLPDDIANFMNERVYHDVLCIGRSIKLYPGIVHHYADVDADAGKNVVDTLHANNPDKGKPVTHTLGSVEWFDIGWEITNQIIPSDEVIWHGSTGLFAVLIGLAMGYRRIALAGCPMDSKGHWYYPEETYGPKWTMESYQSWLEFAACNEAGLVRSMSGYTKTLLGRPDWIWLTVPAAEKEAFKGGHSCVTSS